MSESFNSVCRDFYVNQKLALKMDLPWGREPVLELFDRMRKTVPALSDLRRQDHEISLESPEDDDRGYSWVALRQTSLRSGCVNPADLSDAYRLQVSAAIGDAVVNYRKALETAMAKR
jgi:hypothetical protein